MNSVSGINVSQALPKMISPMGQSSDEAGSFKDFMLQSIQQVNSMQQDADRAVESIFTGGDISAAEVLTAVQKADMAFRLMMQVRNKLVQVYQEIRDIRI